MSFYHIRIEYLEDSETRFVRESNLSDLEVAEITDFFKKGETFWFDGRRIIPKRVSELKILKTQIKLGSQPPEKIEGEDVTRFFIKKPPSTTVEEKQIPVTIKSVDQKKLINQGVFIVHGKDKKPVQELETMLRELGLNSIVLHKKPSGSRTIAEKLEKYSDVGYAFVILTPDDAMRMEVEESFPPEYAGPLIAPSYDEKITFRARQNVVLEFGYFMGKLGRERVCCLYKQSIERRGVIELPSDMHGIIYIPFVDSVNESRSEIMRELKEAGYEIKL